MYTGRACKRYFIEAWTNDVWGWVPILNTPTWFKNRDDAERELRLQAAFRRCRLINAKGKVVLHAGIVRQEGVAS